MCDQWRNGVTGTDRHRYLTNQQVCTWHPCITTQQWCNGERGTHVAPMGLLMGGTHALFYSGHCSLCAVGPKRVASFVKVKVPGTEFRSN